MARPPSPAPLPETKALRSLIPSVELDAVVAALSAPGGRPSSAVAVAVVGPSAVHAASSTWQRRLPAAMATIIFGFLHSATRVGVNHVCTAWYHMSRQAKVTITAHIMVRVR